MVTLKNKIKWPTIKFKIIYWLIPLLTPVSCHWIVPLIACMYRCFPHMFPEIFFMFFVSICPINVLDILNIVGSNIGNSNLVLIGDMCCSRGGGGDCCFLGTFISSNLIKTKAGKWFIKIWQKNQVES